MSEHDRIFFNQSLGHIFECFWEPENKGKRKGKVSENIEKKVKKVRERRILMML